MGTAFVVPISTVTRWFTDNRGLALGIVASGVGAGQVILPPLIRYMITEFGWRAPFAGYIYDVTGDYAIAFLTGGIVLTVGAVLSFIVKPPEKKLV